MAGELKKLMKQINKATLKGAVSAVNKALSDQKTKMVKSLSEKTGLKQAAIRLRTNQIKATVKDPRGSVSVAFTQKINLAEFNPKATTITRPNKAGPIRKRGSSRKYDSVNVSVGGFTNVPVPGGFLRKMDNGKQLVVGRKNSIDSDGTYNNTPGKRTLKAINTDILRDVATTEQPNFISDANDAFDSIKGSEVDLAILDAVNGADTD